MAKKPASDAKPGTYMIDILGMELESGAPHWLDPVHRFPDEARKQEIRDKNRAAYLDDQKKARKPKAEKAERQRRWRIAKRDAESKLARLSRLK